MDGLSRTDKERFIRQMQERVRKALSRVADAVNAAKDGGWINTSEKPVRAVMDEACSSSNLRIGESPWAERLHNPHRLHHLTLPIEVTA